MTEDDDRPEFSVCVFYKNDTYEYVCRYVRGERAVRVFKMMTENVGARTGMVTRVVVTDGGDNTNMEWIFGEGVTYPPELAERMKKL